MYQISVLNAAVLCLGAQGKETNGLPKSENNLHPQIFLLWAHNLYLIKKTNCFAVQKTHYQAHLLVS